MLNNFLISLKVKNAYTVNQIIYGISKLPLIGKIIPTKFYGFKSFKVISFIIFIIREIIRTFGYKLLYIYIFLLLPLTLYKGYDVSCIIHIYIFLALIGSFSNTEIFNPTRDKYYLIVLMKMRSKDYIIPNFIYFLGSTVIGQLVSLILLFFNVITWYQALMLVLFTVSVKTIAISFYFYRMKKKNIIINENKPKSWTLYFGLIISLLLIGYLLPYYNLGIPVNIFYIVFVITLILGIISFRKVLMYDNYQYLCKELLKQDNIFVANTSNNTELITKTSREQITLDKGITSDKSGFAYFHDLFVKRHRKILIDSAKKMTMFILIIGIILGILIFFIPALKQGINTFALLLLPYMLFLMYFINTGKNITNAMFMNCDHSMLFYRFYREPKIVLSLFKERLKTVIVINLLPTTVLALILAILLFLSGGTTNPLNYIIIILSIISMSIFFSIHNLVLYYLLQPYNIGMEMKSTTYTIASLITYWACYYISRIEMSSFIFGIIMIIFVILYSIISLFLVYNYAKYTFKLKN